MHVTYETYPFSCICYVFFVVNFHYNINASGSFNWMKQFQSRRSSSKNNSIADWTLMKQQRLSRSSQTRLLKNASGASKPVHDDSTTEPVPEKQEEEEVEAPTAGQIPIGNSLDLLKRGIQACAFPEIDPVGDHQRDSFHKDHPRTSDCCDPQTTEN